MRQSAQPVGNTSLTKFDVLIIGSGAGGSAAAAVLCAQGQKVLVLECGPNRFLGLDARDRQPLSLFANDELQGSRPFAFTDASVDPRTWRTSPSDGERKYVTQVNALPKVVGGGAVYADLKTPRFQPDDFHLGTLIGGTMTGASWADWPVDYDMLEPFYAWVEKQIGVQGEAGSSPTEGHRSTPYPMPPGTPMYVALKVADAARALGLHPHPYPGAVNSRPYDGRPACAECGFCTGFGCASNAKGTPPVTQLRHALLTGNCLLLPERKVTRLNASNGSITSVSVIGPGGEQERYTADRYVLAASAIESARLCLVSDNLGNSSDQVGRNLTFHRQTNALGIFEEVTHADRGRTISHGWTDFRGVPNDPARPLGGIVEISGGPQPIQEAAFYREVIELFRGFSGERYLRLLQQSPGRRHMVALAIWAEDAPQATNRVDLDPSVKDLDGIPAARVTYQPHAFELSASDFYRPKLLDVLIQAGAKWAIPQPAPELPESAHLHGTLRFGPDARTSVCRPDGRFHDVGNLWCVDGSLFPTSSGFNPTLTIMALATYVAGAMVFPSSPAQVLT
ncbi:MAG: GMC family oxidoreductase [Archangiaceae bacterium]|nr:GMC family oxidoreductase [Archangiaceae bacterium]